MRSLVRLVFVLFGSHGHGGCPVVVVEALVAIMDGGQAGEGSLSLEAAEEKQADEEDEADAAQRGTCYRTNRRTLT
jgi:hypothetical protein